MDKYTEYRQHMHNYASQTMVLSFLKADHPDYIALKAMGEEIIPFLLQDIARTEGEWQESIQTQQNMFCTWAAFTLLHQIVENPPHFERRIAGRLEEIRKVWLKWGEQNGYLPVTPSEEEYPSLIQRIVRFFLGQ